MNDESSAAPISSPAGLPFRLEAEELRGRAHSILASARNQIERLLAGSAPRTLSAFLEPLDAVRAGVTDLGSHGGFLFAVHPDERVRTAGREVSEAAERFFNELRVDPRLYRALGEVPVAPEDRETRFAIEKMRREMRRAGVELEAVRRTQLLELNNDIDRKCNEFQENIARSARAITVAGTEELSGLPPDFLAAHPPGPDGSVTLTTRYPDFVPVMVFCRRAEVRRRLLEEFMNTAHPENAPVLADLLERRHAYARALGYPNWAAYSIETKMLETPDAVRALLDRVEALVRAPAAQELVRFLERKRRDDPTATALENWDSSLMAEGYYDAKIRAEEFGVDPKVLRDFLPYPAVREGLFRLCEELFGLGFEPALDAELWHPTVEAYDVRRGEKLLGRCYLDLVPREGKYNHAACFPVRVGLAGRSRPESALVCNFLDPRTPADRARMELSQVVTFFHEFGHLLHAILSGEVRWLQNGMAFIEWDFVEAPSQLFEEWARDPATLSRFARNPDTGQGIPPEILAKLRSAEALGRPSRWLRQVALAAGSLALYDRDPSGIDASALLRETYDARALLPLLPSYHPASGFGHLTGYSAFYYTYIWSAVIARDLLRPFLERGSLTDPEIADRYAREILAPGSSRPAKELAESYLGRPIGFESFQRWVEDGIVASAPRE